MISRARFLAGFGATVVGSRLSASAAGISTLLDHIVIGCADLERCIAYIEERTGVRAALGGSHPRRGTRNALLSLGYRRYLELLAPDPAQKNLAPDAAAAVAQLATLRSQRIIAWAIHPANLEAYIAQLRKQHVGVNGPTPGSRRRRDGRMLRWETAALADDRSGVAPFFIQWDRASVHPSVDAPHGCELEHFAVVTPNAQTLPALFHKLNIDVDIEPGTAASIHATLRGPKGRVNIFPATNN